MPSALHEALVQLFRNRPGLAPELLRDQLHVALPAYTQARVESAELTLLDPAQLRADVVVLLVDDRPVLAIVVEVQLARDDAKRFSWPVYVAGLSRQFECPACLLVVTPSDAVARWAVRAIDVGPGFALRPHVLGPSAVPVIAEPEIAKADPELAVLSAIAHGNEPGAERIGLAAWIASAGLADDQALLYSDIILASLGAAARTALEAIVKQGKYEYQSDFARKYVSIGRAEGRAEGRAATLLKQLTLKFGPLTDAVRERVEHASIEQLDTWAERILSATTLEEALG